MIRVVGGGPATPEEVAAMAAAIEVLLTGDREAAAAAVARAGDRWRWSGRWWRTEDGGDPLGDWRHRGRPAHPSWS